MSHSHEHFQKRQIVIVTVTRQFSFYLFTIRRISKTKKADRNKLTHKRHTLALAGTKRWKRNLPMRRNYQVPTIFCFFCPFQMAKEKNYGKNSSFVMSKSMSQFTFCTNASDAPTPCITWLQWHLLQLKASNVWSWCKTRTQSMQNAMPFARRTRRRFSVAGYTVFVHTFSVTKHNAMNKMSFFPGVQPSTLWIVVPSHIANL